MNPAHREPSIELEEALKLAKLPEAQPGDLILWDSRTVHGGFIGTPSEEMKQQALTELARLSFCVCMSPRSFATPNALAARKDAFDRGINTTHWPHEFHSHYMPNTDGKNIPEKTFAPPTLTEDQLKLIH